MIDPADLAREFEARFGRTPRCYRAPGRVNLIGEHTDYNDGLVMPMALDRSTWVAAAPRRDRTLAVHSREYAETVAMTLDDDANPLPAPEEERLDPGAGLQSQRPGARRAGLQAWPSDHWTDYVRGVAVVLESSGADILIASDVPIGAGLSSSAALEVAVGYALLDLASLGSDSSSRIDLTALALACQRAEHIYVGARCGVMDQMIACHGRAGHALMLDTRTLDCRWLPLPAGIRVIVCNTMVKHQLAAGEYNARRADCEAGVRGLARRFPGIRALRDATFDELETMAASLSDRVFRRCRHVISENTRVEHSARALADGDFAMFGKLMHASHASLRDDYEVSCGELDTMVRVASAVDGVYGARMTGGGFGGCAIALADAAAAEDAPHRIARGYEQATGVRPDIWICAAGAGAGRAERSGGSSRSG